MLKLCLQCLVTDSVLGDDHKCEYAQVCCGNNVRQSLCLVAALQCNNRVVTLYACHVAKG